MTEKSGCDSLVPKNGGVCLKRFWKSALCMLLAFLSAFFFFKWQSAGQQADILWEELTATRQQLDDLQQELEDTDVRCRELAFENDPIALFFEAIPYSGATDGCLSYLEYSVYRAEMLHAAGQIKAAHLFDDERELVDAYTAFIDAQAQAACDM